MGSLEIGIRSPREKNLLILLAADNPYEWEDFNLQEKWILYTSNIDISEKVSDEEIREFEDAIGIHEEEEKESLIGKTVRIMRGLA